jgi:carbohydrate binding protein with CBM6 domain
MRASTFVGRVVFAVLLLGMLWASPTTSRGATQVFAAGKALTNLQTESVYPGAQNPPYICCWHSQGQYVTFSFTVAAGATTFVLRYSAQNNSSSRKIEVDGATWLANQVFPATASWSTWATLTLSQSLSAGTHTLTIVFDAPSGSQGYLNLDNLTVSQAGSGGGGSGSVTLAAGKAQTNLPTETTWPGAQDPPYICCWINQGQYVTFSFTVPGGPTTFVLRYSAGNGASSRKIELDATTWVAKQVFPGTANWSSWTTLSLTQTLSSGAHTLTILFDAASGSAGYLNLDNLTVSYSGSGSPPPPTVSVALGYADSATGLTPWSGSANTIFIGEAPQCCATHGPDNGQPGYDGGAIEITNTGTSAVTVGRVTVDFGGGSSPASFAIWNSGTGTTLPLSLAAGWHLVLTMTSGFNFDTSDLFGEACHSNSGVIPIVNITLNGAVSSYMDDHQVLNSDGADLASCPGDVSEQKPFSTVIQGAQPAAAPVNDLAPSVTGVAIQSRVLSGFAL